MSFSIAGVGAALVAGAAGAVGSYAVGQLTKPSSSGGQALSSQTSGTAANAADPFASQRTQYQGGLANFMDSPNSNNPDPYSAFQNQPTNQAGGTIPTIYAGGTLPGTTTAGSQMMQDMLTPGYQFNSSDPSYQFRMQQGAGALASSKAASGLLNSGNAATALMDYGQQSASQEYAAQFGRAQTQNAAQMANNQQQFSDQTTNNAAWMQAQQQVFADQTTNQSNQFQQQQQQFTNLMGLNNQYNTAVSNQFTRLAQLSGANIGNPGVAGQLQQQGTAAASAGLQQAFAPVSSAIGKAVSSYF